MSPHAAQLFPLRTILRALSIIIIVALFCWYLSYQARFIVEGPVVDFSNEPAFNQTERKVTLEGQARNIVALTLNGREIYTDQSGYFKEALILENGYTVATITARDRYGRVRSYEESFVYTDPLNNNQQHGNQENNQESS